jgi:hypothetical protein
MSQELEKKYAPALDNYGQSCFVRSDFLKMKCVCKTQMMPRLTIRHYKQGNSEKNIFLAHLAIGHVSFCHG